MTHSDTPKRAHKQPVTLASVIREAREAAGLSIRQLALAVGIHHSVMARIETGAVARPSPEIMQRIAEALELDPSALLTFIGVKPTTVLPAPRIYFRRAYGMTDEEAQETAARIEDIIAELRQRKGNKAGQGNQGSTRATNPHRIRQTDRKKSNNTPRGGVEP